MAGGRETRWEGRSGDKDGTSGRTEENVRFAGGLNTRGEGTGHRGTERGATGGVRARQTLKRKGGPGKRVTGSSGAWVSQVSRAPATWQTQELRYQRAGPKVESESEGH